MRWTVSLFSMAALILTVLPHVIAADAQPVSKSRPAAKSKPTAPPSTDDTLRKSGQRESFRPEWFNSGIPYGWRHINYECELHVVYDPKAPDVLEFRFVQDEVPILILRGHRWSSFVAHDNFLLFTDYHPTKPGCAVEGYNLDDGKRLWRTELSVDAADAAKPDAGTEYYTWARLRFHGPRIELIVRETAGHYTETLDPKTGKSLGRRVDKPPCPAPEKTEQK